MASEYPTLEEIHSEFEEKQKAKIDIDSFELIEMNYKEHHSEHYHAILLTNQKSFTIEKYDSTSDTETYQNEYIEAFKILHQHSQPHLIKIHTIFQVNKIYYIVKEYYKKRLFDLSFQSESLDIKQITNFSKDIIRAFRYFNTELVEDMTLDLQLNSLCLDEGKAKASKLIRLNQIKEKDVYGFNSVPEQITTKDAFDMWNICILLMSMIQNFEPFEISKNKWNSLTVNQFFMDNHVPISLKNFITCVLSDFQNMPTLNDFKNLKLKKKETGDFFGDLLNCLKSTKVKSSGNPTNLILFSDIQASSIDQTPKNGRLKKTTTLNFQKKIMENFENKKVLDITCIIDKGELTAAEYKLAYDCLLKKYKNKVDSLETDLQIIDKRIGTTKE